MEKEKLTFWGIIIEGLKKFAGEIIGALLLALFLYCFPGLRSLITDYVFPKNDEAQTNIQQELEQHRKEEERLKEELRRKEEALREAEEARRKAESTSAKPAQTPKRPAMSDNDFIKLCKSGNEQEVEKAIMNGANVNASGNDGRTALMWATYYGHVQTAEVLLKHGADVNAKDKDGLTALIWIALSGQTKGHTKTVEVLLKHDANINAKTYTGRTALWWAIQNRHTQIADLLRKYGAK